MRECAELLVAVPAPDDGTVFARRTLPQETSLCALAWVVANLWWRVRLENPGLAWVSLLDPGVLGRLLHLPPGARPLAVLCLRSVARFYDGPMLQAWIWHRDRPLEGIIHADYWPG